MAPSVPTAFLAGVIEGFYGEPWSRSERFELFDWMAAWGLNTYLYALKDDLKQRATWRECYSAAELEPLAEALRACQERQIRFIFALSPGLDIRFANPADCDCLRQRFDQLLRMGCGDFALLFDDIPDQMRPDDRERFGSFAAAQCHVTNDLFAWVRERRPDARFLFCPTPYCGRMAERQLGGADYLATVGRELRREVDVFWTGPEIISREITVDQARAMQALLGRKPLIWDNLHANDYDGRRFFCGPYAGRAPELRDEISGVLTNPNNEFPLNYVPLRTLANFVRCPGAWNPRQAYLEAMREWWPQFASIGQPIALEDLIRFGDSYYLPHEEGAEADMLYQQIGELLRTPPETWGAKADAFLQQSTRLREFCARMTELRKRPLFYALSRRVWELREELDLLEKYVRHQADPSKRDTPFRSDFHLPLTYRGGLVPRLQRLLTPHPDETLTVTANPSP